MELNDLSESQKELLQPLLELKTDVSLDSLVVFRDVFQDLSETYSTFAASIKDTEKKLLTCYNIASSGSLTPQACEALLMVRGNTPNLSNVILSATAEQAGVLKVMTSMLSFLNQVYEEANKFSESLDKSVVVPLTSFSNEYLKTFGKDENRAFRQDISGFIPKLKEFKNSPNYSHSEIRKYVDVVLKSHKELQDCLAYESQLTQYLASDDQFDTKLISKAKNRTVRAKVTLGNNIQNLFTNAPELREIVDFKNADVDVLSQISKVSKKQADVVSQLSKVNDKTNNSETGESPSEYHSHFCDLEKKRLELFSRCFQHWMDNHAKYKKGVYSQLELMWDEVVKFSPNNDFKRFETCLTGQTVESEPQHSRSVPTDDPYEGIWIPAHPGPIESETQVQPDNTSRSSEHSKEDQMNVTVEESYESGNVSDEEYDTSLVDASYSTANANHITENKSYDEENVLDEDKNNAKDTYNIYKISENDFDQCSDSRYTPTEISKANESDILELTTTSVLNLGVPSHMKFLKRQKASKKPLKQEETNANDGKLVKPDETEKPEEIENIKLLSLESNYLDSDEYGTFIKHLEEKTDTRYKETDEEVSESEVEENQEEKTVAKSMEEAYKEDRMATEKESQSPKKEIDDKKLRYINPGVVGDPKRILRITRRRLDEHMLTLFNKCREKRLESQFDWLNDKVKNIVKLFEDYDAYPIVDFDQLVKQIDSAASTKADQSPRSVDGYVELSDRAVLAILPYSLYDKYMDEDQWTIFSLEMLVLMHQYVSSFLNNPCMNEETGELREYLLANLGILEQVLIKLRKTIETYKFRTSVSEFEYGILDVALKPRDSFTARSPAMRLHVMDIRYRILLLIDSFSKGDIVIHSEKLFVIKEFYQWMYRQLHFVHITLLQKLTRVIYLIPNHCKDLQDRWLRCINSKEPQEELLHGFKFGDKPLIDKIGNLVLKELLYSLGIVNSLKQYAISKVDKSCSVDSPRAGLLQNSDQSRENDGLVKGNLLELLRRLVMVEDLDEEFKSHFNLPEDERQMRQLKQEDFAINLSFYNDHEISVLAEVRSNKTTCFQRCITPRGRTVNKEKLKKTKRSNKSKKKEQKKIIKSVENDLMTNKSWNKYFNHRVDEVVLSKSFRMEEPVVLLICSYLHKYLTCDEIPMSDFPQHFQTILYLSSFMQTGILPNFNLLKHNVKDNENNNFKNQIPIIAHSIMAASSLWFYKINTPAENTPTEGVISTPAKDSSVEYSTQPNHTEDGFENYKRLRISSTGIKERLRSMVKLKFKITENVAKQLYILLQMPTNLHHLPVGLSDLDSYLLFDLLKYKIGGNFTPEDLMPNYTYQDKTSIELITLENITEMSNSVLTQLKAMDSNKACNKVQFIISQLINYQSPTLFTIISGNDTPNITDIGVKAGHSMGKSTYTGVGSTNPVRRASLDVKYNYDYSLLTPSSIERSIMTILFLRLSCVSFKNELFKCLCKFSQFVDSSGLFYVLSVFVMMFRALYPRLSDNIPNLSIFEADDENDKPHWNMINIFRYIVNRNAKVFVDECVDRVKETNDSSLDNNGLIPLITEEMLQMLRYQCTASSNVWNSFLQFGEFSSLLSNCSILHYKKVYEKLKINTELVMPEFRRLMVLQREFDSSYIVRTPASDPAQQEQRLLNCMFFCYKNSNHKLSGYAEFLKTIKDTLTRALEHKFVSMSDMIDSSVDNEDWKRVSTENSYTQGVVNLVTVLNACLKASFHLSPPVEWLILPFTSACENSIRSYNRAILKCYKLSNLYNIHANIIDGIPSGDGVGAGDDEKKAKKTLWKRLKNTLGVKSQKSSSYHHVVGLVDKYSNDFKSKTVMDDLTRIANMNYLSNNLMKVPEDIFGFYYSQIRQRDPEYEFLHDTIGTSLVSDVNRFFFLEPQQLLEIPHSKSLSSLIFASQRILKRESNQLIMDTITVVMWKLVLVDFKHHVFYNLYTPEVNTGYKIKDIVEKFPDSIFLFIDKIPQYYIQFAYNNFFEAFIKTVFYIIRYKSRDNKLTKSAIKVVYHDVDVLKKLLDKYSQDNLELLESLKNYIKSLIN
uniref:Uncharacterized protein n=1 Tax=Theileria annulata TaxID=5874 RepID=A0A3B0NC20_THEAN